MRYLIIILLLASCQKEVVYNTYQSSIRFTVGYVHDLNEKGVQSINVEVEGQPTYSHDIYEIGYSGSPCNLFGYQYQLITPEAEKSVPFRITDERGEILEQGMLRFSQQKHELEY